MEMVCRAGLQSYSVLTVGDTVCRDHLQTRFPAAFYGFGSWVWILSLLNDRWFESEC